MADADLLARLDPLGRKIRLLRRDRRRNRGDGRGRQVAELPDRLASLLDRLPAFQVGDDGLDAAAGFRSDFTDNLACSGPQGDHPLPEVRDQFFGLLSHPNRPSPFSGCSRRIVGALSFEHMQPV
jgi:hypothetical protein